MITEILELNYQHKGNIVLFKCDWFDNRVPDKWVKVDKFGITNVQAKHLFNSGEKLSDEPFILASQATRVYYVEHTTDKDWYSVVQSKPGILYDIFGKGNENFEKVDEHVVLFPDLDANVDLQVDLKSAPRIREDIDGTIVRQVKKDKYVVFSF